MSKLTFDEFIQLSDAERRCRVHELSPHDLFLVRMQYSLPEEKYPPDLTEEDKKRIDEMVQAVFERKEKERKENGDIL